MTATQPAPTTTSETLMVAPGAKPPVLADGECEQILPLDVVAKATGRAVELDRAPAGGGYDAFAGAGGLSCMWWSDGVDVLHVAVFTADSLSEVDLATVDDWRANPACDWYCSVITEQDGFVVITTINPPQGAEFEGSLHDEAVRIAEQVAPVAIANVDADGGWVRDRTGWLDVDCSALGGALGPALSRTFVGEDWGVYIDPPLTAGLVADKAARMWVCRFVDASGQYIEAWGYAGAAWGFDPSSASGALPAPWVGGPTEEGVRNDGSVGQGWEMSDGVNVVRLTGVPAELGLGVGEVAAALAGSLTP
ncbi:hypothetical protein [Microbacterium timonense]|uniref:hypothetical protein n=1 Tax=Microbacterium timonense TaxID=2086576 RepID=UPI0011B27654|nr:hypothetical protein [Microbacterium timonense]